MFRGDPVTETSCILSQRCTTHVDSDLVCHAERAWQHLSDIDCDRRRVLLHGDGVRWGDRLGHRAVTLTAASRSDRPAPSSLSYRHRIVSIDSAYRARPSMPTSKYSLIFSDTQSGSLRIVVVDRIENLPNHRADMLAILGFRRGPTRVQRGTQRLGRCETPRPLRRTGARLLKLPLDCRQLA